MFIQFSFFLLFLFLFLFLSSSVSINNNKDLTIVAYNDVYDLKIKPNGRGGASRVAKIIEDLHEKDPNTLVLFAGDTISPSLWSRLFKGIQMADAHNLLKLDYASLGNHEFDFGINAFLNVSKRSHFQWLNANCYEISTNKLLRGTIPNSIKTIKNITIGIFGIMYDMNDTSIGVYWKNPIEAAKEQVSILKKKGAEFIIALTHQNWIEDNKFSNQVEGIDLIYGGHDHSSMMQSDFGTPYMKASSDWTTIWLSKVIYSSSSYSIQSTLIPITKDLPLNYDMECLISTYEALAKPRFEQVIAKSCEELDLKQKVVRAHETPIGNFLADTMRDVYPIKATASIMNGGGIRSDTVYPSGNITLGDIASWIPFSNTIVMLQTTGKHLRTFIEKSMAKSCAGIGSIKLNGEFIHPSGFIYSYRCTGENSGILEQLDWDQSNRKTRQIPILPTDEFVLATNSYVLEYSGEVLDPEKKNILVNANVGTSDDFVVENYARKNGICPQNQGRVRIS